MHIWEHEDLRSVYGIRETGQFDCEKEALRPTEDPSTDIDKRTQYIIEWALADLQALWKWLWS